VNPCNDPKAVGGVWQEGCLVKTCNSGTVEESLADECAELIEKKVEKILGEKLAEKGIECSTENGGLTEAGKYQTPGIILAGGSWQTHVKLIKPETKEVCNLPDIPSYFSFASMDLVDGTPIMCGSWFASPGLSRMKNETENRKFSPVSSCVQLSPATKEAEWTIVTENMPLRRDHVSMATPAGIFLMGGYSGKSVDLLKPDGSLQRRIFNLERLIDCGCGIEDEGTLIITGGGSNGREAEATKMVDRYNSKGFVETLPEMNYERIGHGCGYFHKDGKKVLVVGGGYYGRYNKISSTEIFTMGSKTWSVSAPLSLPVPRSFASVSLNNRVYFLAGDGKRRGSLLVHEFDGEKWEETQKVRISGLDDRYKGNRAVAVDLATSGFDKFCT